MKKITIISLEEQVLLRLPMNQALELIATGKYRFTTKGKLKSFINREIKLHKTSKAIEGIDFEARNSKHKLVKDPYSGKTYAALFRGMDGFGKYARPVIQLRVVAW